MKKCFVVNENGFEIIEMNVNELDNNKIGFGNKINVSEVIEMDYYEFNELDENDIEFENELNNYLDMYNENDEFVIYSDNEMSVIYKKD